MVSPDLLSSPDLWISPNLWLAGDADGLAAIVAYTHDLQQPNNNNNNNNNKAGTMYYEMNRMLRDRTSGGREQMMSVWGVVVHYLLKALSKLDDVEKVDEADRQTG